jgi:hypothetical protein
MKRALRRHRNRVAKNRRIRILRFHGAWLRWHTWSSDWPIDSVWEPKVWQSMGRLLMREPGWWTHEMIIQPARAETHRLEDRITSGVDDDLLSWPDCKKPHDYCC